MLRFACDYQEGCLPEILDRLIESNMDSQPGYGEDAYCGHARMLIRKACDAPRADVHFLVGGTQTNSLVLHGLLRHYEGVIAVESGHILGHEAGAVEAKGHKIFTLPQVNGKLQAPTLKRFIVDYEEEEGNNHLAVPKVVYISFSTELGTLYTLEELKEIREICEEHGLLLFVDGARLGYALAAPTCNVTLKDLAQLADVFYIGGTKCGALLGEAVVVPNPDVLTHFFTTCKQGGAVLAKGRLLGIQFEVLFSEDRYIKVCSHAVTEALRIAKALKNRNIPFMNEPETNLLFFTLSDEELAKFRNAGVIFSVWGRDKERRNVCRIATSWATTKANVDELIRIIESI